MRRRLPGAFVEQKGRIQAGGRTQSSLHTAAVERPFSPGEVLGALSPQGSNGTGLGVPNLTKNIIPLLIPLSFICVLFLDFIKCYHILYFLRVLSLFLYYEVIIHSTVSSFELARGRRLGFYFFFPVVSFDLKRKSTGGNCHFNESLKVL